MYLTELLNKAVYDKHNENLGKVKDVLISSSGTYPKIEAIKIKSNGEYYFIPSKYIDQITSEEILLSETQNKIQ